MFLQSARKFIDTNAISANYQKLKDICAPAQVLAVVKCHAYGHGIVKTARCLTRADGFAVATVDEAMTLRQAGITGKILVMQGWCNTDDFYVAVKHELDLVIYSPEHLTCLQQSSSIRPLRLWVKFDTGMNRLGFPLDDAPYVMQCLAQLQALAHPPVLMSHFACADEKDADVSHKQLKLFEGLRRQYPGDASLANSAACFGLPQSRYQWVRAGIALYGVLPDLAVGYAGEFTPAMHVFAPLLTLRQCRKGDSIGYGATHVCSDDTAVGIAGIGYGSGYLRHADADTPVWVCDSRQHLLGRVSMDMIAVSLNNANARIGDVVELWGLRIPVQEVAAHCGTISYELLAAAAGIPEVDEPCLPVASDS